MLVVKLGGGVGNEFDGVLRDLTALWRDGQRWVLVHGGSGRTNEVATALGHPPQFVTSESGFESRRTDRETLKIFAMVYCGEVNTGVVEALQTAGVNALGLSGVDGRLLEGTRKKAIRVVQNGRRLVLRDDYTGTVERVNTGLLRLLLEAGYAPVISPPAISYEGEAINVDGDRAAAAIAAAVGAETLLLLTGAPGLMRRFPDPSSLIPHLPRAELSTAIEQFAKGRMRLKLLAAQEALDGGVRRVILAGSAGEHPVQAALEGRGTVVE